jgi:hypothetical protein
VLTKEQQASKALDEKSSRLLFHPSFGETIDELKKRKITLPSTPLELNLDFNNYGFPTNGELVTNTEVIGKYTLDRKNGELCSKTMPICAYDESVNKFQGLEGTAFLTSHSMIIHGQHDYIPVSLLTFYFYTRSLFLSKDSSYIKHSLDLETDSKLDYIQDREVLLRDNIPENSIVFIDGPLIGSQMTKYTLDLNKVLLSKGVIPIFFVKNSDSNLVTENFPTLRGKFNSDMHWAYAILKEGERTNFFEYRDKYNPSFAKMFCYLKAFDISPQRIEIDIKTFERYSGVISNVLDLIYFLLIVQGDLRNPQIRSIAVAEKYARAALQLINFSKMMKDLGITPTMNQERFAW